MRTRRAEAFDVFRKWSSEGSPLCVYFGFALFASSFFGRIKEVSADRLYFLSDDSRSELELRLPADLEFGYGDPRNFSDEALVFNSVLKVFFPCEEGAEPDWISFAELKG